MGKLQRNEKENTLNNEKLKASGSICIESKEHATRKPNSVFSHGLDHRVIKKTLV